MASPVEDVISLVRFALLDASAVVAIVEDRVVGSFPERTGDVTGEDIYPRVIIDWISGGSVIGSGALQSPLLHVYAYSRVSLGDAMRLYDAIRPALRRTRLSKTGITVKGMIHEVDGPASGFNPQANAWFFRGTYRVMATNLAASD